ncbi:MAG: putative metal-binding motif-containing protein [Alphaproteobacteria bacterium]|nr:putative metal-binding motif-containing protein [Alphaproteobacteria bacterium]MCB9795679.1 putative metal-binding motif-containing protein [Alphaproteobacteria bacterium]
MTRKALSLITIAALVLGGCGEKEDSGGTDDSAEPAGDVDGDGYSVDDGDCDDNEPRVSPGESEVPYDGLDNDCDPNTPDDDLDGDGAPAAEDCNDDDASINPSAAETCDGIDNNCDGSVDEGALSTFYGDADGDGFGDDEDTVEACSAPSGYVAEGGDCDDSDTAYNPDATETDCTDTNDYNCDGSVGAVDADGDGFFACEECDDRNAAVYPGATEVCDEDDNDCDNSVDEGVTETFYADSDGDGYGDASSTNEQCEEGDGYVEDATDCDDGDSAINPGAADDYPDGVDDDCDGTADDEVPSYSYASDIQSIFNSHCTSCHGSNNPSAGLSLTSYGNIVNAASSVRNLDQIEPGDTATSYLWHKINGTQSSVGGGGSTMPRGGSALSTANLEIIEIWILTGAAQ